jgi:hypothetical protein
MRLPVLFRSRGRKTRTGPDDGPAPALPLPLKPTGRPLRQIAILWDMRWWLLSRDEATHIARQHVEAQGLPWAEPVRVSRGPLGGWSVVTNANHRGGNIFMEVTRRGRVNGGTAVTSR